MPKENLNEKLRRKSLTFYRENIFYCTVDTMEFTDSPQKKIFVNYQISIIGNDIKGPKICVRTFQKSFSFSQANHVDLNLFWHLLFKVCLLK